MNDITVAAEKSAKRNRHTERFCIDGIAKGDRKR